ncbi:hypothetical protein RFI_21885 [Reticulomyxa filosa]|uniref:Uncharacterized protein n=1 Tax=Reticulomyxa filosa TaxID=46433 RepID=X6MNR2_RETFI|nr:hypothetical protein RFI_21885 [Reticulomyxa filosa]|eukprot:ETO15479.1 hypothetical protein RFI_21885 [Reticulomyxa filosa]
MPFQNNLKKSVTDIVVKTVDAGIRFFYVYFNKKKENFCIFAYRKFGMLHFFYLFDALDEKKRLKELLSPAAEGSIVKRILHNLKINENSRKLSFFENINMSMCYLSFIKMVILQFFQISFAYLHKYVYTYVNLYANTKMKRNIDSKKEKRFDCIQSYLKRHCTISSRFLLVFAFIRSDFSHNGSASCAIIFGANTN